MAPKITLYQFAGTDNLDSISPFCVKAHRMLRRKGLAYEVKNLVTPGAIRKVNPIGKLPVIDYDGQLLADSAHIARFLDEKHPDPPFFPKEEIPRARNTLLEDWADESLYFKVVYFRWMPAENIPRAKQVFRDALRLKFPLSAIVGLIFPRQIRAFVVNQGTGRKPYKMVAKELAEEMDALDALCAAGPFLLGNEPYLADIAIYAQLEAMTFGATPDAERIILDRPRLSAWLKRVDEATRGH